MATQNLLDILRQWPQSTTIQTPKKTPELFVPTKISDTNLTNIIKSTPATAWASQIPKLDTNLLNIIKDTPTITWPWSLAPKWIDVEPTKDDIFKWTKEWLISMWKFFTDWDIWKEMRDKLKEWRWDKEPNPLEKAVIWITYLPFVNKIFSNVIEDTKLPEKDKAKNITLFWQVLTDFGLKTIMANPYALLWGTSFQTSLWVWEDLWLWTQTFLQESRQEYEDKMKEWLKNNLKLNEWDAKWVTRILTDVLDVVFAAIARQIWQKTIDKTGKPVWYTIEWAIQSAQDIAAWLLQEDEELLKLIPIIWAATTTSPIWVRATPKTPDLQKAIPDDTQVQKTQAQIDWEIAEKQSPTKTSQLSKKDIQIYPEYMRNKLDWETLEQYKARVKETPTVKEEVITKVVDDLDLVKTIKETETPKKVETLIEKIETPTKKTKTELETELWKLQTQRNNLEKRVVNKPQLQKEIRKVDNKIKQIESQIKLKEEQTPARLQKAELFPEAITEITPAQKVRAKLTKKRAKEIKKAIFDELKERRQVREKRLKSEQKTIQTEEWKARNIEQLRQENRRKELEELYVKTDNIKDFEDIVYNDRILSDDNKIRLLEDIQDLETMKTKADTLSDNERIKLETERNELLNKPKRTFEEDLRLWELRWQLWEWVEAPIEFSRLWEIMNEDISKSPNIEFELWIIQKWLQKVPIIWKTIKATWKLYTDIRNKLNNIQVINPTLWILQWIWDVLTWIWWRKNQIIKQAKDDFWINEITSWSENNSKTLRDTRKNLNKQLQEIFTYTNKKWETKTLQERIVYAKSYLKEQYYDFFFKNNSLSDFRFISDIYFSAKKFTWKDISNMIPEDILKKIKEVEDNIAVKYDDEWNPINPNSIEYKMYQYFWEILVNEWFLKPRQLRDKMKRWVISREMFDYMKKNDPDLLKNMDIKTYEELIQMWYNVNLSDVSEIPKYLSSILKSSKNAEIYHSHDPITRMISYIDQIWQLKMNKEMVDFLNNTRKSDDSINRYIWDDIQWFLKTLLRLHDLTAFQKTSSNIIWWLWSAAIIMNPKVMSVSFLTTTVRSIPAILKNITWIRFRTDVNKVNEFLDKTNIETRFLETTNLGKIIWANYSLFSGWTYDRFAKWIVWRLIMERQINKVKWEKVKWENIVDTYQRVLEQQPIETQNKMLSDLWRQILDIADYSNQSRWQILWLNQRMFNVFKNFARTTISRYLNYPTQTINESYTAFKKNLAKWEIADRNFQRWSFLLADTLILYYAATQLVDMMWWDKEENEETKLQKEIMRDKLIWWNLVDRTGMLFGYWLSQPWVSMTVWTFNNIAKFLYDLQTNWLSTKQFDYTQIAWVVRTLKLLTDEKSLTTWWLYKYSNEWSDNTIQNMLLFSLWYSNWRLEYETAKKKIEEVVDQDKWFISEMIWKIINDQNWLYSSIWETWDVIKYIIWDRDEKNDMYNFTIRTQSKRNIDNVITNILDWSKTPMDVEQWLINAWDWFEVQTTEKKTLEFLKSNLMSNKNYQTDLLKIINELWVNKDPLYRWDMNTYMNELKEKNPALFSQIMKKVLNPVVVKIDNVRKTLKDLEFTGQESWMSFIDEILVERFENYPRLVSDLSRRLERVIHTKPTSEELDSLNNVIKVMEKLPNLWDDVSMSIADTIGKKLKNVEDIKQELQNRPELYNMIVQALKLRWVDILKPERLDKQTETTTIPSKEQSSLVEEILSPKTTLPTWTLPTKQKKQEKFPELIEIMRWQQQPQPLYENITDESQSLIDILLRS